MNISEYLQKFSFLMMKILSIQQLHSFYLISFEVTFPDQIKSCILLYLKVNILNRF